eukprot:4166824-Amphidinium_carterae.1
MSDGSTCYQRNKQVWSIHVLGSINPVPKAPDTTAAHMRIDFIDAVQLHIGEDDESRSASSSLDPVLRDEDIAAIH